MRQLQQILNEITVLTANIETNYTELYRYLDEDPITINTLGKHLPDQAVFEQYLNNLKAKLRTYLDAKHKNKT